MSFAEEKESVMEKGTDGKMKSVTSIPANYVSILQLQERWMKEKERKHKERDLGVKQLVNEQRRREEEEEPKVKLEGKSLGGGLHINPRKEEPNCIEKEEAEVSVVVSKKEEDGEYSRKRKKKRSKKKNQGGSVKEVVKCGSKAYIPREINQVREKTVQNRENAAASNSIAVETQFQHLQIKERVEEDRQVKGPAGLKNMKHERRTMMWVKKGENNEAGGGNGFNV